MRIDQSNDEYEIEYEMILYGCKCEVILLYDPDAKLAWFANS